MSIKISNEELSGVLNRATTLIGAEIGPAFSTSEDHYRILSDGTRTTFAEPELLYCSLFDDISELKKIAHDTSRPFTPVDLERLAAVLIELADQMQKPGWKRA